MKVIKQTAWIIVDKETGEPFKNWDGMVRTYRYKRFAEYYRSKTEKAVKVSVTIKEAK